MSSGRPAYFPRREETHVLLAHVAYRLGEALAAREPGLRFTEVRSYDALEQALLCQVLVEHVALVLIRRVRVDPVRRGLPRLR